MLARLAPKRKRPERLGPARASCGVIEANQAPGRFIWQLVGVLDT
jgi:hypothetical protein